MHVEIKSVTGWKWDTLEEIAELESACMAYFDLPLGDTNITTGILGAVPSYGVRGGVVFIDFYYVADTYPSQIAQVPAMPDPTTFDILIVHEE
jgi:hypothetical protein